MKKGILLLFSLIIIIYSPVRAQDYAASVKISTLGINLEAVRSFGSDFNARLGFAFFNYSANSSTDEYTYNAKAKLSSVSILADYFPFGGSFRVTGGLLVNLNRGDIHLVPTESIEVGGDVYSPENLGSMDAVVDFNKTAPYIGIGFGNPTSGESGLGVTFDIGTAYQGVANIDLSAEGLLEPSAAPDQEQTLRDNLNWFKWYPVVSLGLVYKF